MLRAGRGVLPPAAVPGPASMFDSHPTPFDVRFSVFGIPVRVHPMFWLIMGLLGDSTLKDGPAYLLLWIACGFVSVMVHELGQALFIRRFGSPVQIVLIAFGGAAIASRMPYARWKRIVISLAGPGAGFLLLGLVVASNLVFGWSRGSDLLESGFTFLVLMNLFWNLFNLLPIWPLDGGHVCRELCGGIGLRRPDATAFFISFATAGGLALIGLMTLTKTMPPALGDLLPWWLRPGMFMSFWMAMFAFTSFQLWQAAAARHRGWDADPDDDTPPWRR
ncbi:MAG: site-2 protease family protein [Fimbriiglobus sp.]